MQTTLDEFIAALPRVFDYGYSAHMTEDGKIRLRSRFGREEHPVIVRCSIMFGYPYCERYDCNPYQVAFYCLCMAERDAMLLAHTCDGISDSPRAPALKQRIMVALKILEGTKPALA